MAGLTTWGVGGLLAYLLTKAIYRVYLLHLLRNIPGPKLAAITSYYEFYFNVIKRGTFVWHLEKLHETYGEYSSSLAYGIHIGPIVRVGPARTRFTSRTPITTMISMHQVVADKRKIRP